MSDTNDIKMQDAITDRANDNKKQLKLLFAEHLLIQIDAEIYRQEVALKLKNLSEKIDMLKNP